MLNHSPGNFEGVRQLLGHYSVDTTSGFMPGSTAAVLRVITSVSSTRF